MQELQSLNIIKPGDQFTLAHTLLTLQQIASELILGRYEIEKNLKLSNSTARILLRRLVDHNLIKPVKRKGHCLTTQGQTMLTKIKKRIPFNGPFSVPNLVPEPSYLIQIAQAEQKSQNGIIERDLAVRYGARGGITIQCEKKKLVIPGVTNNFTTQYPQATQLIESKLTIKNENTLFIAFADTLSDAAIAAISVGFWLLEFNSSIM
jgi:hypothetical protein